jgi:hypothetical protein
VTLAATVGVTAPGSGAPTGTVTFKDGSKTLGTAKLSALRGAMTATFVASKLAAGSHNITASYAGDGNFNGSVSTILVEVVSSTTLATPAFERPDYGSLAASSVLGSYRPGGSHTADSAAPCATDAALLSLMEAWDGQRRDDFAAGDRTPPGVPAESIDALWAGVAAVG